jgi:hypothetical protein
MRYVLDDERLEGPQTTSVAIRPSRMARPIPARDMSHLLAAIDLNCQIWGGAAAPFLPLDTDGRIDSLYRDRILGAHVDRVDGVDLSKLMPDSILPTPAWPTGSFREQLAVMFLEPGKKDSLKTLTVPVLVEEDPWRPIYAACFGSLPEVPSPDLIKEGYLRPDLKFEEFIDVERVAVTGSLDDLLNRAEDYEKLYPRSVSMVRLAYGLAPTTSIRAGARPMPLPGSRFEAWDAGPNIVVVCTPGDIDDVALLWNLRATHGDSYATPLGILVDEFGDEVITRLHNGRALSHQGISRTSLYITSTSVSVEDLEELVPGNQQSRRVAVVAPELLCDLGPAPARSRNEVTVWADGQSTVVPVSSDDRSSIPLRGRDWTDLHLELDVRVNDSPFPKAPHVRAGTFNEDFFAGAMVKSAGNGTSATEVIWPSRYLMLKVVLDARGLKASPSEPGKACLAFLESLPDGVGEIGYLADARLLGLLDSMAQRLGTAWAKAHLRDGEVDRDVSAVAPTEDDLPEVTFNQFRDALGSTKAARAWLDWAERRRLVVKGFPITCDLCGARQWAPVSGFVAPLTCRGCAREIVRPFPIETVSFKYRLGESIRRVYESDAVGHLLLMNYLAEHFRLFRSSLLVGTHPGLNISRQEDAAVTLGEADVLSLLWDGSCIPGEVKRSFGGVSEREMAKLDALADAMHSPWSIVVVPCWGKDAPKEFTELAVREGPAPHRVLLTYDHLLHPMPTRMGQEEFAWSPWTDDAITERQDRFQTWLEGVHDSGVRDRFEDDLMYVSRARRAKTSPSSPGGKSQNGE